MYSDCLIIGNEGWLDLMCLKRALGWHYLSFMIKQNAVTGGRQPYPQAGGSNNTPTFPH